MSKKLFFLIFLLIFVAGCSTNAVNSATPNQTDNQDVSNQQTGQDAEQDAGQSENTEPIPAGPNCYGEETHPIGNSIAELYVEITDYTQVMTWFCAGFEFEDIITALETQTVSDVPADELLTMFQNGQDWDEIWASLGIVEN